MNKKKDGSMEENFFSRFSKSFSWRLFKKYARPQRSRPEDRYLGRIMVPSAEKIGKEIQPPHTFPPLYIRENDAWRMFYLADARPSEVSLLMSVDWSRDQIIFNRQIFPRQFCSTVKSDIDPKWMADYSRNLSSPEERATFNCNFWMHSHMSKNMARWSNYDNLSIGKMIRGKKFLISVVVVPQDGTLRYRCRFDLGEPFFLTIDDIPIFIIKEPGVDHKAIRREADNEYRKKVVIVEDCDDPDLVFGDDPSLEENKDG